VVRDGAPVEPAAVEQEAQPPEQLAQAGRRLVDQVIGHLDHVLETSLDVDPLVEERLGERHVVAGEQRIERAGVAKDDARAIRIGADEDPRHAGRLHGEIRPGLGDPFRKGVQSLDPIRTRVQLRTCSQRCSRL